MAGSSQLSMALISGPSRLSKNGQHQVANDAIAVYPLTHSQEGIWIDYLADRTSTQYNLTVEWRLTHTDKLPVSVQDIVAAILELTKRHSALRSTVVVLNGKPHVQEHDSDGAVPEIRLMASPVREMPQQQLKKVLHEPFDLEAEFPVRWYAIQQPSSIMVYVVAHHLAIDGGGLTQLAREFLNLVDDSTPASISASEKFSQAHAVERAWALTEASKQAEVTCFKQIMDTYPFRWPAFSQKEPHDFRHLHKWATFSKDDLQSWSTRFSTSWFRVSVALVGLLLHIETDSPLDGDHLLGVSFGGRPQGFENTVGQFANPLPVKIPVLEIFLAESGSVKNTLAALVKAVSSNISQVKKAERLSLLDIARRWRVRDHLGHFHTPQVAVSFSPAFPDDRCRLFPVEGSWDLFFVFQDSAQGVELGVIYNPELFDEKIMNRMKSTYMSLLELILQPDPIFLNQVPGMPRHLTIPFNTTDQFVAVHDMFRMHAAANPHRVALSCAETGQDMTYGELDDVSTLRAHVLESHGAMAESVVILHLHRGFHLLEWILAILKAGSAYVYLDPKLPTERKQFVLGITAGPGSVLVTEDMETRDAEWTAAFPGTVVPHQHVMELSDPGLEHDHRRVEPGSLAYMIMTSGSTGEPKAVMIQHGSFAHFVRSSVPIYRTGHNSRVLQLASFNFDASILEWSSALAAGGTLCFAESPHAMVGDYLADVIEKNAISFMQVTPSALATVPVHRQLDSLRRISVGGEAVSAQLLGIWRKRVPIINSYGPTETSVAVAFQEYPKGGSSIEQVSVGHPPKGTNLYICDPSFTRILPYGTEGEICIGGDSLGRGYCQRPALSDAKFAIHPRLKQKLYRSGDRGMMLPDGSLIVRGRMDREIKMRGYRIAPEEIEEAIIASNATVRGVSAQVSPDGLSLVAIVTPETCSIQAVQSGIAKILPAHMRPSTIIPVSSLPINSSGKIDHKKIKEDLTFYVGDAKRLACKATSSRGHIQINQKQPRQDADLEKFIARAWQEEIGLAEPPSTNVNFYDVGGHSHLVPRLQKQISSAYPTSNVSTIDLFHHSTVESQAKLLRQRMNLGGDEDTADDGSETSSFVVLGQDHDEKTAPTNPYQETEDRSIAIVGMAGKFPAADGPDKLYDNLSNGVSGISHSPGQIPVPHDCIWIPRAGTLSDIEEFDSKFWKLTREEAADMDPQQRLFLVAALQALEDAGLDPLSQDNNNIGVFVGAATNQYHTFTDAVYGDPFQRANRGFVAPCISARTAYHLNLHGPNVTINTNCASSTVAMALAVDALRNHRCDVAVVGGVSVQLYNGGYVTQPKNIFSVTGQCKPFEEDADGTVPSDAVVAVVLRRKADVLDDETMYALVVGAAYNSDGATGKAGYQVPSPQGQSDVIAAAWMNARLPSERLQYVELHGSGTPIGDALELEGIKESLAKIGYPRSKCLVGSNKGSLGNTQHASGLVSLVKICKSIQNGTIPAMVRTGKLNPMIADTNLQLQFAYEPTKVESEALIGISAAGWGGVNSHIVIQAPPAGLIRKVGDKRSKYTFVNETLAAPRKASHEKLAAFASNATDPSLELVIQAVQEVLGSGTNIEANTDLRALGFDSAAFVRLSQAVKNARKGYTLAVSSFVQPLVTPATLAAGLQMSYVQQSVVPAGKSTTWPQRESSSLIWTQLNEGDSNSGRVCILLPPSGGTCIALARLVSAIPRHIPVYGLEHPGHHTDIAPQGDYSVAGLAGLYTNEVCTHLDHLGVKEVIFIGASFGGVVATEMLGRIVGAPERLEWPYDMRLVLLDAPIPGISLSSDVASTDLQKPADGDESRSIDLLTPSCEGASTPSQDCMTHTMVDMVHRMSVQALREYPGPDATVLAGVPVLYISARQDSSSEAVLEEQRAWWVGVLPTLRWEEMECTHEELWQEKAEEVIRVVAME